MKYRPINLFLFLFFVCFTGRPLMAAAQQAQDSLLTRRLQLLQQQIGLSQQQVTAISAAHQWYEATLDSLQQLHQPLEQRSSSVAAVNKSYESRLKAVLNPQQWVQYQQLEADRRNTFRQKMQQKNIPLKEAGN